ncbi:hypothetical protein [Marinobacter sp. JSM 1782161]|uniref:hypothetical protein n=1 Tax=Marinobacter sp. JSM 1782161 TaxID=2685906 RepID=UPI001403276A|nr:hypothetical protein [Marinobacter sp. JSM 1782161]
MFDTFCNELQKKSLKNVAQEWVIDRTPYIFEEKQASYVQWKSELSNLINVDGKAISIIGSSCLGFSLNPSKGFRVFNEDSDIDIAIISRHHFELAWHTIRNIGTEMYSLNQKQRQSLEDHRKRLIYWGTFDTKSLLTKLPFGKQWFEAFSKMSEIFPTEGREINARIYRDFESLTEYQTANLAKLRDKILEDKN